jgi:hypothetical protein
MMRQSIRSRKRKPVTPRTPSFTTLRHHYARLLAKPNVTACYVGKRTVDGEPVDEISIVCCVTAKQPRTTVRGDDRIPRHVIWQGTSKNASRIRTDVIEIGADSGRHLRVTGPGDIVVASTGAGPDPGTVGMAIDHPSYGPVVTTAAHLFVSETYDGEITYPLNNLPRVQLTNSSADEPPVSFIGSVLRVVMHPDADYALIFPDPKIPARNLFRDQLPFPSTAQLDCGAIGDTLFVANASGLHAAEYKGCQASIPVGASIFHGAILTERVTSGGDSGCTLVDGNSRICGLLVGFSGPFSVFMSPYRILSGEQATLTQGEFNEENS